MSKPVPTRYRTTNKLPGLAMMIPEYSGLLRVLNQPGTRLDDGLVVIAGDCRPEGVLRRIGLFFADLYFGTHHDLMVDTASIDGGGARPVRRVLRDASPEGRQAQAPEVQALPCRVLPYRPR